MYSTHPPLPATLAQVLAHRHPGVVRRYCKEHHATPEEAGEVFREMLKWLYLCARSQTDHPGGFPCAIYPEVEKIDWMWHTFLLFTRDYADFCERNFGFFIHHTPGDEDDTPVDEDTYCALLEQQYTFVCDVLGVDTLTAWYDECRYAAQPPAEGRRGLKQ
jgi:hypothetical protein